MTPDEVAEIDRARAANGLLPLDDPNDLPGRWTVKLTVKRHGIRGHKILHWPPLESAVRSEGIEWGRCHRWLVRQAQELAATGRGGEVIRVEFEPVGAGRGLPPVGRP